VRVSLRIPVGHYRTLLYVRGTIGLIERAQMDVISPGAEGCAHNSSQTRRLYRAGFRHVDLWAGYTSAPSDELVMDVLESWLEPA
jgi:nitrile hydratase subunit beta